MMKKKTSLCLQRHHHHHHHDQSHFTSGHFFSNSLWKMEYMLWIWNGTTLQKRRGRRIFEWNGNCHSHKIYIASHNQSDTKMSMTEGYMQKKTPKSYYKNWCAGACVEQSRYTIIFYESSQQSRHIYAHSYGYYYDYHSNMTLLCWVVLIYNFKIRLLGHHRSWLLSRNVR